MQKNILPKGLKKLLLILVKRSNKVWCRKLQLFVSTFQSLDGWGVDCQEEDWQMTFVSFKSRNLEHFSLGMHCSRWGEQWFAHPWMLYVVALIASMRHVWRVKAYSFHLVHLG